LYKSIDIELPKLVPEEYTLVVRDSDQTSAVLTPAADSVFSSVTIKFPKVASTTCKLELPQITNTESSLLNLSQVDTLLNEVKIELPGVPAFSTNIDIADFVDLVDSTTISTSGLFNTVSIILTPPEPEPEPEPTAPTFTVTIPTIETDSFVCKLADEQETELTDDDVDLTVDSTNIYLYLSASEPTNVVFTTLNADSSNIDITITLEPSTEPAEAAETKLIFSKVEDNFILTQNTEATKGNITITQQSTAESDEPEAQTEEPVTSITLNSKLKLKSVTPVDTDPDVPVDPTPDPEPEPEPEPEPDPEPEIPEESDPDAPES
jgi:hypothetical protein